LEALGQYWGVNLGFPVSNWLVIVLAVTGRRRVVLKPVKDIGIEILIDELVH